MPSGYSVRLRGNHDFYAPLGMAHAEEATIFRVGVGYWALGRDGDTQMGLMDLGIDELWRLAVRFDNMGDLLILS
jgi:hypothetical protein